MLPKCYILVNTFNWKGNVILHLYGTMFSALMEKVFVHFTVTITACYLATRVHVPRCLDSIVVSCSTAFYSMQWFGTQW